MDFIAAAQIAEQLENESEDSFSLISDDEKDQVFIDHCNYTNLFDNSVFLLQFMLCCVIPSLVHAVTQIGNGLIYLHMYSW